MIDVAVVGCGFMGRNHAHAVSNHPCLELSAVVDLDQEAATAIANRHNATATTDFEAAVKDVEAVIIATPETAHAEQANTVLDHDRHLLLEKPVTVDTSKAWALADRAAQRELVTGVSFVLRYDPGYAGVREAVQNGQVGEPISVRAMRGITREESRRVGERGHPLYYMNVHDIDAMQWTVGGQIREVVGVERRGQLDDIDIPDVTHATLTFESGAVGTLTGYGVLPNDTPGSIKATLELIGTTGTANVDTPGTTLSIHSERGCDRPDVRHWPVINGRMDGAVRRQIDHFERAIASEGEMLASIQDGAHAQAVADAVRQSITDGSPTPVERPN